LDIVSYQHNGRIGHNLGFRLLNLEANIGSLAGSIGYSQLWHRVSLGNMLGVYVLESRYQCLFKSEKAN